MPRSSRSVSWRRRSLLAAFALVSGLALLTVTRATPVAEEVVDLTLLYHGSVQGKVAPCG